MRSTLLLHACPGLTHSHQARYLSPVPHHLLTMVTRATTTISRLGHPHHLHAVWLRISTHPKRPYKGAALQQHSSTSIWASATESQQQQQPRMDTTLPLSMTFASVPHQAEDGCSGSTAVLAVGSWHFVRPLDHGRHCCGAEVPLHVSWQGWKQHRWRHLRRASRHASAATSPVALAVMALVSSQTCSRESPRSGG